MLHRCCPRTLHLLSLAVLCLIGTSAWISPQPVQAQPSITNGPVDCQDGTANRYSCENVNLLSFLSITDLGAGPNTQINDVWGWTDPLTGTEYAIVGRTNGVSFVDVSTPTEPVFVGELPTHSGSSTWRDVKVYADHAFVVSESSGHGMQIFDLTQLREVEPSERPARFSETAHYNGVEAAHNVVINSETGFAYIVGGNGAGTTCGGGLHMVDVQTPTSPTFVGCFSDPATGRAGTGYTHDAQCVVYDGPDTDYQGDEICFNANETALNIANVTDKSTPQTLANATYPQVGYTHQAWLTEDHRYLYVDDELDESSGAIDQTRTLVFDVSDLDSPELVTSHSGTTGAIDHNQYIHGTYSYQANYQSGLRILDVAAPENPEEVAFFDTYPSGNDAAFDGAWSTYPFFERNIVLISSIGEGLFVVQPTLRPVFSLRGSRQGRGALFQWTVSADAETERIELEHKPPGASTWMPVETFMGQGSVDKQEYEYVFESLSPGTHQVRVRHVSTDGTTSTTPPATIRILPTEPYVADGPFPNPAQNQALFTLTLREAQELRVALYDVMGRRVRVLYDGPVAAGVIQRIRIRARDRASGTYFLRVQGESFQLLRKVVITQ